MATVFPQVVGSPTFGESNNVAATTLSIPKPAGVANGDILVAALRNGTSAQATDYTLAGWTRRAIAPFPTVTAATRLTGMYTHFVTNAGSEPANYVFDLAGNAFARQSGMIFIVRPGVGGSPWGVEPPYTASGGFTGGSPPFASTFAMTPGSLVIYASGNELVSPNATATYTPPTGATGIGIHGSLQDQALTGSTRSVIAAAYEAVAGNSAGGSGKTIVFPAYSTPVPLALAIPGTNGPIPAQDGAGATVYVSKWNGTAEENLAELGVWYPGYASVASLLAATDHPTMAHRGGSLNWPEHSEWAYDHSVMRGYGALEFSCGWSSDLVPFGLGQQYLDDMVLGTPTTTMDPTTMTWATISGFQNHFRPVYPGVFQPIYRLVDFLTKYTPTHICIVDPKYGFADATKVNTMLDIMDAHGGPTKIMCKFDSPTTSTTMTSAAHARGYKCINYWNSDLTAMAAQQAQWDVIGANYGDPTAMAQALTYGKPSWAAIVPTQAGYAQAVAGNATLVMCSDVANILPSTWWN